LAIVVEPTQLIEADGFTAKTRRVIKSQLFDRTFGDIEWPDAIAPCYSDYLRGATKDAAKFPDNGCIAVAVFL